VAGTSRTDVDALVVRSVELKRELLEFSCQPRFDRAFQEAMAAQVIKLGHRRWPGLRL
jgi:hypothetical protein